MNNWAYAGAIPTGDFRGSMALPREYSLREIDGEVRLVQKPVEGVEALRRQHVAVEDVSLGAASLNALRSTDTRSRSSRPSTPRRPKPRASA